MKIPFKVKNITGQRFGKVVAVRYLRCIVYASSSKAIWECLCDCGTLFETRGSTLIRGDIVSCGCSKIERLKNLSTTHGLSGDSSYPSWAAMMSRCYNSNRSSFKYYGERGIEVCERWHDLKNFMEDMGPRPEGTELDRIDVDGHYCKENCRWTTKSHNQQNKRSWSKTGFKGVTLHKKRYRAEIMFKRKAKHIGYYDTAEEAAKAYDVAAKDLFGEFAKLNFPVKDSL